MLSPEWLLLLLALGLIGVVVGQVLLSLRRRHWALGLVLPGVLLTAGIVFFAVSLTQGRIPAELSAGKTALAVAALFFLYSLPGLLLLGVYAICRMRKLWAKVLLTLLLLGCVPMVGTCGGGSSKYVAVLYTVELDFCSSCAEGEKDVSVKIFPFNWFAEQ